MPTRKRQRKTQRTPGVERSRNKGRRREPWEQPGTGGTKSDEGRTPAAAEKGGRRAPGRAPATGPFEAAVNAVADIAEATMATAVQTMVTGSRIAMGMAGFPMAKQERRE